MELLKTTAVLMPSLSVALFAGEEQLERMLKLTRWGFDINVAPPVGQLGTNQLVITV